MRGLKFQVFDLARLAPEIPKDTGRRHLVLSTAESSMCIAADQLFDARTLFEDAKATAALEMQARLPFTQ